MLDHAAPTPLAASSRWTSGSAHAQGQALEEVAQHLVTTDAVVHVTWLAEQGRQLGFCNRETGAFVNCAKSSRRLTTLVEYYFDKWTIF